MDNEAKNEILAAIQNISVKIDVMHEQVAKIPEIQKEVAKIPQMQEDIAQMQKEIAKIPQMQKDILQMQQDIRNVSRSVAVIEQTKIPEIQQDIRNISRSVAVIEHEHGDKLKALFDAFTTNTQKIEKQEENIKFCEKKLENHDTEIDFLLNKVQVQVQGL